MPMKRTPMKRTAWPARKPYPGKKIAREVAETVTHERHAPVKQVAALLRPVAAFNASNFNPVPKTVAYRDKALTEMARNRPCLLAIPKLCNRMPDTTVAAHSNWSDHGKGGRRKADDCYSVWACSSCHIWLDQSGAPEEHKRSMFKLAYRSQVGWWTRIANDTGEPERFQKAASRALAHIKKSKSGVDHG